MSGETFEIGHIGAHRDIEFRRLGLVVDRYLRLHARADLSISRTYQLWDRLLGVRDGH